MEEAAANFEDYEPEGPVAANFEEDGPEGAPSDQEEAALVQQDIFIHCVRNRKPEHVPLHIFLRLPGECMAWTFTLGTV